MMIQISNGPYFLFIHRSCPGGKQSRKNIDESNASTEGEKERELRQREAVLEPARNKLCIVILCLGLWKKYVSYSYHK